MLNALERAEDLPNLMMMRRLVEIEQTPRTLDRTLSGHGGEHERPAGLPSVRSAGRSGDRR
jgi:hypothetical protein